jgi:hypothetical protein
MAADVSRCLITTDLQRQDEDWPRRITGWRVVSAPQKAREKKPREKPQLPLPAPGTGNPAPFPWRERAAIAADRPQRLVRVALFEEVRQGRVELDGNGRIRLRAGALADDVIEALARLRPTPAIVARRRVRAVRPRPRR